MIRLLLLYILALFTISVHAQTTDENPAATSWYSEPDGINWLLERYRPIYDFKPRETIASIGAGQGIREVVYSLMADSLTVYLQDVETYWLSPERLYKTLRTIYGKAGRSDCSATFKIIRGTDRDTGLPTQLFDKIIIENSLHEFDHQAIMLQSIRDNLKPGGTLFVWEEIATKPNRKHSGCRKPMFTDQSLRQLMAEHGFQFVDKTVVDPPRGSDVVYRFSF
ncbi:class I SAM-dependent methyltransferase [Spirosoma montaniterrae]|uniref:Uncharacterized protein n=1 Tax=Spirosoma montaniterrae TaxID=1178516 RepID=A0A1P9WTA7_9BACT|nr:methyltransferase domain-containing protein [Spirosoma montaniterrae]AQG78607.1 hypothetical protein AWR27_04180 [Spirosoma montaniterrae]